MYLYSVVYIYVYVVFLRGEEIAKKAPIGSRYPVPKIGPFFKQWFSIYFCRTLRIQLNNFHGAQIM